MFMFDKGIEQFERLLILVDKVLGVPNFTILVFNDKRDGFDISKRYAVYTYNSKIGIKTDFETTPRIEKALEYLTEINKEENITKGIYGIGIIEESVLGIETHVLLDAYDIVETNSCRGVAKLCERMYTECVKHLKG